MLKKLTLILSILMAFSMITACDDDSTSAPTLPVTEVEDSYYSLFCNHIDQCDTAPFFSILINDQAGCLTFLEDNFSQEHGSLSDIIDAVNAGTVVYDGQAAYKCLEEQETYTCQEFGNKDPESCKTVFTGTVEDDGSCELNEECLSNYCDISEACPGTCKPAILEGRTCEIDDECQSGTKCVNYSCQTYSVPFAAGDDCEPGDNDWCAEGLFCHDDDQKCVSQIAIGSECDGMSDNECGSGALCAETSEDTYTCVTLIVVENENEACESKNGIRCAMYNDLACKWDDFETLSGVCVPAPALGDVCFVSDGADSTMTACNFFDGLYCDTGDYTQDGTCKTLLEDGAVCEGGDCKGFCNENNVCESGSENMCE
jgi:hypothetical protein